MTTALDIIVPAFNAAGTLADTLRSALAQTRPDIACVVIDDGSTDATPAIARSFADPRIRVISQQNQGLSSARNRGIAESSSPFLAFLDADDTIEPAFASRMLRGIGAGPIGAPFDLIACATRFAGPRLEPFDWTNSVQPQDLTLDALTRDNPVAVGAVVLRRGALDRPGALLDGRLFDPALPCVEDWDAWRRLTSAGCAWAPPVGDALFNYRLAPGSMSTNIERMWRTGLIVIDRSPAPVPTRALARSRWTTSQLARAIALLARPPHRVPSPLADPPAPPTLPAGLIPEMLAEIESGAGLDAQALASSIRHAIAITDATPIASISPARALQWQQSLADRWPSALAGARCVLAALSLHPDRWTPVARAILALDLAPPARLVLFGMGRNAHALLRAIERLDAPTPALFWCDDAPAARAPEHSSAALTRLDPRDLRPADVVLVTPDQRADIIVRLVGRVRVETPESLVNLAPHAVTR